MVGPVRAVEGVAGLVAGGGGQLAGGGAGAGARAGCGGRAWRRRVLWAVACEPGSGTLQDVRRGGGGAAISRPLGHNIAQARVVRNG